MALVDDLITARDALIRQQVAVANYQATLALTGQRPVSSYSLDGESFSYVSPSELTKQINDLSALIASLDPGEEVLHGWQ
jgi:hypothetical protein